MSISFNGHTFSSSISYKGVTAFVDQNIPTPGKTDFGMDTITRKMRGAAFNLIGFLATLKQGITYFSGRGGTFYLQSWTVEDHPTYPTVTLTYKGLGNGVLPDPVGTDSTSLQSVTITTIRPTNASRQIEYYATNTTWRYVANKRPEIPRFGVTSTQADPVILKSVIFVETDTKPDGQYEARYSGANAPADLVTVLHPSIINMVTSRESTPVIGSPYFECSENVARIFYGV